MSKFIIIIIIIGEIGVWGQNFVTSSYPKYGVPAQRSSYSPSTLPKEVKTWVREERDGHGVNVVVEGEYREMEVKAGSSVWLPFCVEPGRVLEPAGDWLAGDEPAVDGQGNAKMTGFPALVVP